MASFCSDGLTLAYDDIHPAGDAGATIVLVHGFATSRAENWRRLGWYGAFERKGYRTIAFDLRGHGESDKPHDSAAYARREMAADVVRLLDHLGVARADLMGYSLGAHLAAAAALAAPARFDHLILGGAGGRWLNAEPTSATMSMAQAMRLEDSSAITDPTLNGFRKFAELEGADRLALAACSEGAPLAPALAELVVPVLVVAGAEDRLAGDPEALAAAIPGARSVALPGCDHFTAIPHALYKAAVFDFLEGWLD